MFCELKKRTAAFTLIELLVVISIIALLAAILFPVFARVRENARRTSCLSNLKQLGMGMIQYTQDFDEQFPVGVDTVYGLGPGWGGQLYPYVKASQIYQCPSFNEGLPSNVALTPPEVRVSYGYNTNVTQTIFAKRLLTKFTEPPKTVLIFEVSANMKANLIDGQESNSTANSNYCTPAGAGVHGKMWRNPNTALETGSYTTGCLGRRYANECYQQVGGAAFNGLEGIHLGGANYLLADGHVKWYRGDNVSSGYMAATPTAAQITGADCSASGGHCFAEGTSKNDFSITFSPT